MKTIQWIAWFSLGIGVFVVLLGVISGVFLPRPYLGLVTNTTTFFTAADSFFLFTIALFIFLYRCKSNNE